MSIHSASTAPECRAASNSAIRYHSLDAARSFALLAGVVLHATIAYQPGLGTWAIVDPNASVGADFLYYTIHIFRMPVFFLLAGFFARLMFLRRGAWGFLQNRFVRIVVPLIVGWSVVYQLNVLVWAWGDSTVGIASFRAAIMQIYENRFFFLPNFPLAHFWFLYYLVLIYCSFLLLRYVLMVLPGVERAQTMFDQGLKFAVRTGLAPLVFATPALVTAVLLRTPELPTPDGSFVPEPVSMVCYSVAFMFGWGIHRNPSILGNWSSRSSLNLFFAVALILTSWIVRSMITSGQLPVDGARLAFYASYHLGIWTCVAAVIGLSQRLFSKDRPGVRYVSDASYWIYLVHIPLVAALQISLTTINTSWIFKLLAVLAIATPLLFLSYQMFVRHTVIGLVLNGRREREALKPAPLPIETGGKP